jgi:hypothetical protein
MTYLHFLSRIISTYEGIYLAKNPTCNAFLLSQNHYYIALTAKRYLCDHRLSESYEFEESNIGEYPVLNLDLVTSESRRYRNYRSIDLSDWSSDDMWSKAIEVTLTGEDFI